MDSVGPDMQVDIHHPKATRMQVLLIHPDAAVGELCRNALEKHGFDVETVAHGSDGVHRAYELIPDIILAGSAAPELDGYQICRLIKHDPVMKRLPVLLIADKADKMDRFWGVKAGADDFLRTDELEAKLLRKIQMLLEVYERMGLEEKQRLRTMHSRNPLDIQTRLGRILDTSLVESTLMVEFRSLADLVHDPSLLNYMLFSLLESLIDYDAAAIFYNDDNKSPRQVMFHVPEGEKLSKSQIETMMDRFFERFKDRGLTAQQLELLESEVVGALEEEAPPVQYQTTYVKEVYVEGKLLGALCFYAKEKVDYPQIFPVPLIESEIRLLMKLRNLYSRAELLAISDSLTNLFNQKHFLSVLQREFKASQRYELDLSLALVTVDNFKRLNDEWGHACGDEVLRHIAKLAEESFRSVDVLARFGGKSLAILLPKTALEQSRIALERFQRKVAETPFEWEGETVGLSVSIGLVSIGPQMPSVLELIKQAEAALQQARSKGCGQLEAQAG
ncbi:MAG TPA: diguanylate cyclase [Oculatellaceae cyanobacterium]|jgi:two-component system cell cycle response regulator